MNILTKILSLFLISLFALPAISQDFEGTITYDVLSEANGTRSERSIEIKMKNGQFALVLPLKLQQENSMTIIGNRKDGSYHTLTDLHGQKLAMQYDLEVLTALMKELGENDWAELERSKLEKGGSETINGFEADVYTYQSQDMEGKLWISTEFKSELGPYHVLFGLDQGLKTTDLDGLVLKMEATDKKTGAIFNLEAKPKKESIADASFEIPAAYSHMNMTGTMEQLKDDKAFREMMRNMNGQ